MKTLIFGLCIIASFISFGKKDIPKPELLNDYPFTTTLAAFEKKCKKENISFKWEPARFSSARSITKELFNIPAKVVFTFGKGEDSVISEIIIKLPVASKGKRAPIQKYNKLKSLMIRKYGIPSKNKKIWSKRAPVAKYKRKLDGETTALWNGHLQYACVWNQKDYIVGVQCLKMSGKIYVLINYLPPRIQTEKQELKITKASLSEI